MNRFTAAAAAIALVVPAAAGASGITYDCDTAPGHFSDLLLPAPADAFTVSGNVQVNRIAKDGKWAPTARVRIGSAAPALGAAPEDYDGVVLTAVPGKAMSLSAETVQTFSFDHKGRDSEVIPSSLQATGAAQPFRLSFDGRSVTVSVANESRTYPLQASAPVVEIICSTGEFLFSELRIEPTR